MDARQEQFDATTEPPQTDVAPRALRNAQRVARVAPVIVVAICASVLAGWAFGVRAMTSGGFTSGGTMKYLTAMGLMACAVALVGATQRPGRRVRAGCIALALVASGLGALILMEHLAAMNLGLDTRVFADPFTDPGDRVPGRPSPPTAVGLVLIGVAVAGVLARSPRAQALKWAAPWLALAAMIVPGASLFDYVSGIGSLYAVPPATQLAATTAVAFILLGASVMAYDPTGMPVAAIVDAGPRGQALRHMLPAVVLVPFAVGVVRVLGERAGLYTSGTGVIITVGATTILSVVAVWIVAQRLERVDVGRRDAEDRHAADRRRMRVLVEEARVGIVETDAEGRCTLVNPYWVTMTGLSGDRIRGVPWTRLVHPDDLQRITLQWRSRRQAEEPFQSHFRLVGPGGRVIWIDSQVAPVTGADGAVTGWVGTHVDVSHRVHEERELRARERVVRAVADGRDPSDIFALIAEEAARVLEADSSAVTRFDPDAAVLVGTWAAPGLPRSSPGTLMPLQGGTAAAIAARTGRVARVDNYSGVPEVAHMLAGGNPYRCAVAAPVRVAGRTWGALTVGTTGAAPLPSDTDARLQRLAGVLALAVSGADALARLRRMATTDHLTGLPNARALHGRLAEEVERAHRHGRMLSLVVLDLDHFKTVNDTHGHQVGDRVLVEATRRMAEEVRLGETIGRVGGEEFAWILPDTDALGAFAAAERMRQAVSHAPISPAGRITVSAGVCELSQAREASELFRLADMALYWAKANGRDTTFRYSPEAIQLVSAEEQGRRLARAKALSGIRILAQAVDAKDRSTQRHSERVADLAEGIALTLGWQEERAALLREAALVHDVGKIGVPDHVLLKNGPLDAVEFALVKEHPALSAQIVADALSEEQTEWVRHHHERVDGTGYPDGVGGRDLSEGARILAVADAWDAMTSLRTYRLPRDSDDALRELERHAGTQFCPRVVEALRRMPRQSDRTATSAVSA